MSHNSQFSEGGFRIEQKCAYHPKQSITNFCKRQECLLPVCPICIQVHTQQHKMNKTSPRFQEINNIFAEIKLVFQKLNGFIAEISQYLSQIQSDRKKNENEMRQIILKNRQKLIKQFQQSLIDMENNIIEEIVRVDKNFVTDLAQVDQDLTKIKARTKKSKFNLQGEESLKHIIIYYGKKNEQKYKAELDVIKKRADDLAKATINVVVREQQIQNLKQLVERFIQLQIVDSKSKNNSVINQVRSRRA